MRRSILIVGPVPAVAFVLAAGLGRGAGESPRALEGSQPPTPPVRRHAVEFDEAAAEQGIAAPAAPSFAAPYDHAQPSELLDAATSRERQARHLAEARAERSWGSASEDTGSCPEDSDHMVLRRFGRRLVLRRAEHPVVFELLDEATWLRAEASRRAIASSEGPGAASEAR